MGKEKYDISFFERYLTLWVFLGIITGIGLGALLPSSAGFLESLSVKGVNLPIAVLLFGMMYPIMVQIDFSEVKNAVKAPRPVLLTLIINWAVKPFTMFFFAWLFMRVIFAPFLSDKMAGEYMAGMILLGIAPCTAMVLVWSYLARGFMGLTLVLVAINSLTMLVLYAPLGNFLLGVADMPIPFITIFLSIILYVGVSLVAGYISRTTLIKKKGIKWYESVFLKDMGTVSKVSLLATLVYLFMLQGGVLMSSPLVVALIAVPLFIQTVFIFAIGYKTARVIGLRYEDAAPAAMIGASNHFEVAIATAVTLFGVRSGAALATVVGVLIEVPVMLMLVKISLRTRHRFKKKI
ncbi:MAG: ACR3 family arsenite efflux transporter [Elusimicrobia bacterium]|jgi:ACR3 family arsenite transporter|nr:ACR3 family arsenite efflux transporter [Elusimicrobiota bacterium]